MNLAITSFFWKYYKLIFYFVFTWQAAANYKMNCLNLFVRRFWLDLKMHFP